MTVKKTMLVAVLVAPGWLHSAIAVEEGEGQLGSLMFRITDINSDGIISREEHVGAATRRAERNFDRIDSNGDGYISPQEARQASHKLREFIKNRGVQMREENQNPEEQQP
jgi:Ca2+-binding EF-hand superfamily protein